MVVKVVKKAWNFRAFKWQTLTQHAMKKQFLQLLLGSDELGKNGDILSKVRFARAHCRHSNDDDTNTRSFVPVYAHHEDDGAKDDLDACDARSRWVATLPRGLCVTAT